MLVLSTSNKSFLYCNYKNKLISSPQLGQYPSPDKILPKNLSSLCNKLDISFLLKDL